MITKTPKNILLADDSIFFRTKLSTILLEAGHKVRVSANGKEVIKEIQADPTGLDLLILDLHMPELDGFGVLDWIEANNFVGKFNILVITAAYELTSIVDRLKRAGVLGVMTKAYTAEQVVYRVNRLLFNEKTHGQKSDRAPVSIPVDFSISDKKYSGLLLNISPTGLFLHTIMDLAPKTGLTLVFSLYGYDRVFNLKAEVVWSTPSSGPGKLFTGVGVKFSSITNEEKAVISEFVAREQQVLIAFEEQS
ncbi:MAG: response regulator [Deltaproteobacteria bacterium]|nr:response regulator [Deltaproteobacteria bacterium]